MPLTDIPCGSRRTALVAAVLVSLLLLPATADARIVPQRSIKGVHVGWSKSRVRAKLGTPGAVVQGMNEIAGPSTIYVYGRTRVTFLAGAVAAVVTTSRRERTRRGVGVGSTRAAVAARVPRVRCRNEFGRSHCYVGTWLPGRIITVFDLSARGRVRSVTLSRVID